MNVEAPTVREPLDVDRIRHALPGGTRLGEIALHDAIPSTNTWLLERAGELSSAHVCLAEHHLAGRGRLGRTWVDGPGQDLCLSVLWRFSTGKHGAQGLSLAVGVAAVRALRTMGADALGLKWPNDVVWRDRKLAGILIEGLASERVWTAVIGVGLNVREGRDSSFEGSIACLDAVVGAPASRNDAAARLISEIWAECRRFEGQGVGPALDEWAALDVMKGRAVTVVAPAGEIHGIARGADPSGELLVEVDGRMERFVSAEVSLRAGPSDHVPEEGSR